MLIFKNYEIAFMTSFICFFVCIIAKMNISNKGNLIHPSLVIYEAETLFLNGVSVSNTRIRHQHSDETRRHVSVKCPIQKIFVGFLTILAGI